MSTLIVKDHYVPRTEVVNKSSIEPVKVEGRKVICRKIVNWFEINGLIERLKVLLIFSTVFIVFNYFLVGWRFDHTILIGLVVILTVIHKFGYQIVLSLAGFLGLAILYDAITIIPNYDVSIVHIKDLYDLEIILFGVLDGSEHITLGEWFQVRQNAAMSLFCGASYLLWLPGPMVFSLYLLWKDKPAMVDFVAAFLLTNIIGLCVYYLYPAAPPWYYLNYGDVLFSSVQCNEALLSEFDRLTHTSIFHFIYTRGSNVFGAVPSLHSAYPLISLLFAWKHRHNAFVIFFAVVAIGTWIGAVYTQHHYVIDILLGIICAVLSYLLILVFIKTNFYDLMKKWYLVQLS